MKRQFLILSIILFLSSCFWDPDFSKEIRKPYYLGIDYGTNQVCLHWTTKGGSGGTEKIPSKIIEIGWDDKFIIAKQVSIKEENKINYYIIETNKDSETCYDCPIGPLTKTQYLRIRDSLKIPNSLKFKWGIENFETNDINNE